MEHEGPVSCSEQPAAGPYPGPEMHSLVPTYIIYIYTTKLRGLSPKENYNRLCGLVVRGPGWIPGATRFSEK
jgi:hypothetical protein